jgi:hypothetical protein
MTAMAKVARNISKATEAVRKVPESSGDPVHASSAKSLAVGPRAEKLTLQRVPPPLCRNKSSWKREGQVAITSMALGSVSFSKDDSYEYASSPAPHFMVLVDLCKSFDGECYYPYSALDDLGATHNFIS